MWANKNQLHKIAIVANSLSSYPGRLSAERYEQGSGTCAAATVSPFPSVAVLWLGVVIACIWVQCLLLEVPLENTYHPPKVFNDTCFHTWYACNGPRVRRLSGILTLY